MCCYYYIYIYIYLHIQIYSCTYYYQYFLESGGGGGGAGGGFRRLGIFLASYAPLYVPYRSRPYTLNPGYNAEGIERPGDPSRYLP